MTAAPPTLAALLERAATGGGNGEARVVFLTGAGISAESGIPTFRGPEGYWRVGAREYHPTELATFAAFSRMPEEIWGWYLYRRATCRAATPNAAHAALVKLERQLGDRFLLVTQNVDGLHLRAGNTAPRTFQIHGNIDHARCAAACTPEVIPLPADFAAGWPRGRCPGDAERAVLTCRACGGWRRPHVLWFDESYDEEHFRFESSLRAAETAALLVIVGTSGATTLPARMCHAAASRSVPLLVIDPETTAFAQIASASSAGIAILGTACTNVPPLCEAIATHFGAAVTGMAS